MAKKTDPTASILRDAAREVGGRILGTEERDGEIVCRVNVPGEGEKRFCFPRSKVLAGNITFE